MCELVADFRETGSVQNKKRQVENSVTNESVEIAVLGQITMNSTMSTRKLTSATGVCRTSVQLVLKNYNSITLIFLLSVFQMNIPFF